MTLAAAVLLRKESAVCPAPSAGTNTPRSSNASDVGTTVLDIGAEGLVCVAVAVVAGVSVEGLCVRHGYGGKEGDCGEELHFELPVAGIVSSLYKIGGRRQWFTFG